MSWVNHLKPHGKREPKQKRKVVFEKKLAAYLSSETGVDYSEYSLRQTVDDVEELDGDLKRFLEKFVDTGEIDARGLGCDEYVSIDELIKELSYNPVTAALLVQLYRERPILALKVLMSHDLVRIDKSKLPPVEMEEESL